MEHRRMSRIRITSIDSARSYEPKRWLGFHHGAYLHRRSMSAEELVTMQVKSIMHLPCWVVFGNIQSREVVPVIINAWAIFNLAAHTHKDLQELLCCLRNRVNAS